MLKALSLIVLLFLMFSSNGQPSSQTLDVVCWNIEWFGSATEGPFNKNLQEQNAVKILRYLDADIYGLSEIVDTARFRRLVDSLGSSKYAYVLSPTCTGVISPAEPNWQTCQKLAFIYNKTIFSNIKSRAFVTNSTAAYSNFATGRLPFLLEANATVDGVTRPVVFIVIHGKSGSTSSDYSRRQGAAREMRDSIEVQFANKNVFIIGDYNDDLQTTISAAAVGGTLSSYDVIVRDSSKYNSISIALSRQGDSSTLSYSSVIDNHIVTRNAALGYVANSVKVRRDITTVVPDYRNRNTSDHWPIYSRYLLNNIPTTAPTILSETLVKVFPNPFNKEILLNLPINFGKTEIKLLDILGKTIWLKQIPIGTSQLKESFENLSRGIYFLHLTTSKGIIVKKIIKA